MQNFTPEEMDVLHTGLLALMHQLEKQRNNQLAKELYDEASQLFYNWPPVKA